jgi:hypothetical protein
MGKGMVAYSKLLALAAAGAVTILWLGPRNDSGEAYSTSELAMNAPAAPGCGAQRGARCTIDIRYAYPAAELFVLPEDAYF